jgi:hypothetical protein
MINILIFYIFFGCMVHYMIQHILFVKVMVSYQLLNISKMLIIQKLQYLLIYSHLIYQPLSIDYCVCQILILKSNLSIIFHFLLNLRQLLHAANMELFLDLIIYNFTHFGY